MATKPRFGRRILFLFASASVVFVIAAACCSYGYFHFLQWSNRQAIPNTSPSVNETTDGLTDTPAKNAYYAALEKEHAREKIIADNLIRGRVTIPRSPSVEIFPVLLEKIPKAEGYEPVELKTVKVQYTEQEFKKEREEWYRKLLVEEYLRVGDRDPQWNDRVIAFLTESARRLAVRRFQSIRRSELYDDQLHMSLADDGFGILELGCNDPLVRAMLLEELFRQGRYYEGFLQGKQLIANLRIESLSELAKFEVIRPLLYWEDFIGYGAQATLHFRKSLIHANFNSISRRIMYYEGQVILKENNYESIPEFILSLNFDEDVDPWLRNMLMADFYQQIALDASLLRFYWVSYAGVARDNPTALRAVHTDHLRRAYLYYLQAWKIEPELVESLAGLFPMSFEQVVSYNDMETTPSERLILERLSDADPRFWFDQVVSRQFDFLPIYRRYLSVVNPPRTTGDDSPLYSELMRFGTECLDTGQFATSVPFEYYDALLAVTRKLESETVANSHQKMFFYASEELVDPLERLLRGYSEIFDFNQQNYFSTVIACVLWQQGKYEEALNRIEASGNHMQADAFQDMFVDPMEFVRARAGRATTTYPPRAGFVVNAEWSPHSARLVLSLANGRVGYWDMLHNRFEEKYKIGDDRHVSDSTIAISENAAFASAYQPPSIQIINTDSFARMSDFSIGNDVQCHLVSRNGQYLACADGKEVRIWSVPGQKSLASIPLRHAQIADENSSGYVRDFTFSEDDALLAFVVVEQPTADAPPDMNTRFAAPDRLMVWNLEQQKIVYDGAPFAPDITSLRFCEEGQKLLLAGTDWHEGELVGSGYKEHHRIRILDLASGKIEMEVVSSNPLRSVMEFGEDRSRLVAFDNDQVVVLDRLTGMELSSVRPFADNIAHLVSDWRTSKLIALDNRGGIVSADELVRAGSNLITVIPDLCRNVFPRRLFIEPTQKLVAVCDAIAGGKIWRLSEGKTIGYAYREASDIGTRALAFSADLRQLATTPSPYTQPTYTPSFRELSSALVGANVQLWDTSTNRKVRTLEGCTAEICSGDFSPDGKLFVAGLQDGNIAIWDLRSDSSLPSRVLGEHVSWVTALSFSADGKHLLTAANKGESFGQPVPADIKLWEVASELSECKVIHQFEFLPLNQVGNRFLSLDISDNGKFILASDDVSTCVFSCEGEKLVEMDGTLAKFRPNDTSFIVASSMNTEMTTFSFCDIEGVQLNTFISGLHNPVSSLKFSPDGKSIIASCPNYGLAAWEVDSGNRVMFISDLFEKTD